MTFSIADVRREVGDQRCPRCSAALDVVEELVAHPLGSHSLAGAQMKVSATQQIVVVCTGGCGLRWRAHE